MLLVNFRLYSSRKCNLRLFLPSVLFIFFLALTPPTGFAQDEDFELARKFANSGEFDKARTIWEKLAAEGDARSQAKLGLMYARGDGVIQNLVKARGLFESAANAGNAEGLRNLSKMYLYGDGGLPVSPAEAEKLAKLADAAETQTTASSLAAAVSALDLEPDPLTQLADTKNTQNIFFLGIALICLYVLYLLWKPVRGKIAAGRSEQHSRQQNSQSRQSQRQNSENHKPPPLSSNEKAFDPYEILGIKPGAGSIEISGAYKQLMQKNHPDKVASMDPELQRFATERTKLIQKAYDALK